MDPIILETVGGVLAATGSGGGIRALYVHSRNQHQAKAQDLLDENGQLFSRLEQLIQTTRTSVEALTQNLGEEDARTFTAQAEVKFRNADEILAGYVHYADSETSAHNPAMPHRRKIFVQISAALRSYRKKLKAQIKALENLEKECEDLQRQIDAISSTLQALGELLSEAESELTHLKEQGWNTGELPTDLLVALRFRGFAQKAQQRRDMISCLNDARESHKRAEDVLAAARRLPIRRDNLLATALDGESQHQLLVTTIKDAAHTADAIQALYAEVCWADLQARLAGIQTLHEQILDYVQNIRDLSDPKQHLWDQAETTAAQLKSIISEIKKRCDAIHQLDKNLANKMERARKELNNLREALAKLQSNIKRRKGKKQQDVMQSLAQVEMRISDYCQALGDARPNPNQLLQVAEGISNLINRLDEWSEGIDEDRENSMVRTLVIAAAAAIGLDELLS